MSLEGELKSVKPKCCFSSYRSTVVLKEKAINPADTYMEA